ncbi:MAG: Hsp20/alpha crystallin family protein [Firmicutes bacterium]|nr:Hsp20/alpha crystallin family protein [Bacillota bacterium]
MVKKDSNNGNEGGPIDDIGSLLGNLGLSGIFRGLGNFVDLISRMVEDGTQEISQSGEIKGSGRLKNLRGVYGFSVKLGQGGLPKINDFGNIRRKKGGPIIDSVREPLVDVFNEAGYVLVVAEMPGVHENEITVKLEGDILIISAENASHKYYREILLPASVAWDKRQILYKDGILEVRLDKMRA